jgi:hypothetical protein
MDSGFSLREPRNDKKKEKAGIAPGLPFLHHSYRQPYFASARFGGVAGHDFTSVS